jgi:Contractile injection system tube protein
MTTFPGSPRLTKGSIIAMHPSTGVVQNVIAFQYNPETLSRSFTISQGVEEGSPDRPKSTTRRARNAPQETITLEIELDATDRLEKADSITVKLGIHPQLAALEMLIYPNSKKVAANMIKAAAGVVEVEPIAGPLTVLVWGLKRVVPVSLNSMSITEEAYDTVLNPIRAKVSLGLRILNYEDFTWNSLGGKLFFSHHVQKEALGKTGAAIGASTTVVNIPASF